MNCPHCGLINPKDAVRCDCGYNFQTKMSEPLSKPSSSESAPPFSEHKKFKRWSYIAFALGLVGFFLLGTIGYFDLFSPIHFLLFILPGALLGSIAKSKKPKNNSTDCK